MKIKKLIAIFILIIISVSFVSCSSNHNTEDETDFNTTLITPEDNFKNQNVLIVYFSQAQEDTKDRAKNGTTEVAAKIIQDKIGADIFRIETKQDYPENKEELQKTAEEEKEKKILPELKAETYDMSKYDIIIIGYPIWCNDLPMAVYSFIENNDFTGKDIIPFSTHSTDTNITGSEQLRQALPSNYVDIGMEISDNIILTSQTETEKRIAVWLSRLQLVDNQYKNKDE